MWAAEEYLCSWNQWEELAEVCFHFQAACRRPDCDEADQIIQKTLTIPDIATVADACSRMATRRVDAALLTDSNVIIYGIITDKVRTSSR
jgi:hypothetical protein